MDVIEIDNGRMLVEWDVPIEVSDGNVLRADVFRPVGGRPAPVLLSYGPYGKGLAFQEGYPDAWTRMAEAHPDTVTGSSNRFQNWEVVDPEQWVGLGYACVRVDARGCGRSPGYLDPFSRRETQDLYECIEWAGTQAWSTGKVGLSGISYFAQNQWQAAALRPPHLAAICPWEGSSDWYRELSHHGGILCTFADNWYDMQVTSVQYGNGSDRVHPYTGMRVTGDVTLSEEELRANRVDYGELFRIHEFEDEYFLERTPDLSRIEVPVLSAGNWGGAGLHLRGNVEGFLGAGSKQKWLELHGHEHWTEFYTAYGRDLQRRFFDHFLKGVDNGWDRQPPVLLRVRHADGTFEDRSASAWPLSNTAWTSLYLDSKNGALSETVPAPSTTSYIERDSSVTFELPAFDDEVEITGPSVLNLYISTDADDADLFVILRVYDAHDAEVTFNGAIDPRTPPAQGWLRASHRELHPERSTAVRPYHPHRIREPLHPGEIYEVNVEIWPTSLVLPAGYRLAVSIQGHDYEVPDDAVDQMSNFKNKLRGSGPFLHDDPVDRRASDTTKESAPTITIHSGPDTPSHLVLPFVARPS